MELPIKSWAAAIPQRKSVRNFTPVAPGERELGALSHVAHMMRTVCPGARAVIVDKAPAGVFKGIIGAYGAVQGAPACAVFVADGRQRHHQAMTGFLGEAVVLEATALGLATCWIGGGFRSSVVSSLVDISENERILAVTPLGYAAAARWDDKLVKKMAHSSTRKSLAGICDPSSDKWPLWAQAGLAAARMAPSGLNRQPWRFAWRDGLVTVSADSSNESRFRFRL